MNHSGWHGLKNSLEVDETKTLVSTEKSAGKWFVPALVFMIFALNIANLTLALLTREIGATFFGSDTQATVGITSQLSTIGFAAAVATGVAMSILAIRFGHKALLMTGILLQTISAAGAFLAPTFLWLVAFFALEGVGSVLSGVAFVTLVGDYLPQNRKARAVSYIAAAVSLAT